MTTTRRRRPLRWLALVILLLGVGEGTVRIVDASTGKDSSVMPMPDPSKSRTISHPYVGFVPRPDFRSTPEHPYPFVVNSLGFRGEEIERIKPAGTFRVACVGGSTTWGDGATGDEGVYPHQLQLRLNEALSPASAYDRVEVINAGTGHYTTMESFINLKTRLLPLDIDLVVVYHGANDAQVMRREGFVPDFTHVRRSWTPPPPRPLLDEWLGWSHLYGVFLSEERRLGPRFIRNYVFVEHYNDMDFLSLDEMGPGFETFYWSLREIVAVTRSHGAEVVLCTFAWPREGGLKPKSVEETSGYAAILRRLNRIVASVSRADNALLVDLYETGPSASSQYWDPIHPNDRGYALMAEQITKVIVADGMLSRPPKPKELPPVVRFPGEPVDGDPP